MLLFSGTVQAVCRFAGPQRKEGNQTGHSLAGRAWKSPVFFRRLNRQTASAVGSLNRSIKSPQAVRCQETGRIAAFAPFCDESDRQVNPGQFLSLLIG